MPSSLSRTPAQRRAAQRLAHLGRSVQPRAADEPLGRLRAPRDPLAPRPPRPPAELAAPGLPDLPALPALPELQALAKMQLPIDERAT